MHGVIKQPPNPSHICCCLRSSCLLRARLVQCTAVNLNKIKRYVFDGRLEEACLFLSRLLDVQEVGDIGALTKLVSGRGQQYRTLTAASCACPLVLLVCVRALTRAEGAS